MVEGSAGSTGGRECPGRSGLFMSGEAPDADILGLMRAEDGSHGLRARAPGPLVPLRSPLTFNLALRVRWGEGRGRARGRWVQSMGSKEESVRGPDPMR